MTLNERRPKMANTKKASTTPKHSGFEAPCKGIVLSKNSTITKNADGTLKITEPKRKKK